jgi:hypothetical protein
MCIGYLVIDPNDLAVEIQVTISPLRITVIACAGTPLRTMASFTAREQRQRRVVGLQVRRIGMAGRRDAGVALCLKAPAAGCAGVGDDYLSGRYNGRQVRREFIRRSLEPNVRNAPGRKPQSSSQAAMLRLPTSQDQDDLRPAPQGTRGCPIKAIRRNAL